MPKVIADITMSLDGYVTGPGADVQHGLGDAPEVQNFLSGIVLGLRHQTPEDIEEPFQQTGTLHLFGGGARHIRVQQAASPCGRCVRIVRALVGDS